MISRSGRAAMFAGTVGRLFFFRLGGFAIGLPMVGRPLKLGVPVACGAL